MVDVESYDWKLCCDIIDELLEIGDSSILCDCIRMCCANSKEVMDCVIGQYGYILEELEEE